MLAIVGPTASGKSALALALARHLGDVELVSADSMQVYRGMDIGTAKPTAEERAEVPHHLVDVVEPNEEFSLSRFVELGRRAIADIEARGKRAVVVGGTGLYVRGLVDDLEVPGRYPEIRAELDDEPDTEALHRRLAALDPMAAGRMEATNRRRIVRALEVTIGAGRPFSSFGPGLEAYPPTATRLIGLHVPNDVLDDRIERRVHAMVADGLVEEVRGLRGRLSSTAAQALGYKEVLKAIDDGADVTATISEIVRRTRQFARRQQRWYRRDPRIEWRNGTNPPAELVTSVTVQ